MNKEMKPILTFINQYLLLEQIGKGVTSELFRAFEISESGFKRTVIFKRFYLWVSEHAQIMEDYFHQIESFRDDLPKELITVLENGNFRGQFFQVREYIRGQSIENIVRASRGRGKQIPIELSIFIAAQVARTLSQLDRLPERFPMKARYHGFLNPQQLVIGYESDLKILNYTRKLLRPLYTVRGEPFITAHLPSCAPEMLLQEPLDFRTDLYSLGTVLYFMVTGHPLFSEQPPDLLKKTIVTPGARDLSLLQGKVPKKLKLMIEKMIHPNQDERYLSVGEFLDDCSILIDFNRRGEFTQTLKSFMNSLFSEEIQAEKMKIQDEQNKYQKMIGIAPDGEDKYFEPTEKVKLSELTDEMGSQEDTVTAKLFPANISSSPQSETKQDLEARPMSPEEVGDFLDKAVHEILSKSRSDRHDLEGRHDLNLDWQEVELTLEKKDYQRALSLLKQMKVNYPGNKQIEMKIFDLHNFIKKSGLEEVMLYDNDLESTQPIAAHDFPGKIDTKEQALSPPPNKDLERAKTFSYLNIALWFMLALVSILLVLILFYDN